MRRGCGAPAEASLAPNTAPQLQPLTQTHPGGGEKYKRGAQPPCPGAPPRLLPRASHARAVVRRRSRSHPWVSITAGMSEDGWGGPWGLLHLARCRLPQWEGGRSPPPPAPSCAPSLPASGPTPAPAPTPRPPPSPLPVPIPATSPSQLGDTQPHPSFSPWWQREICTH